MIQSLVFVCPFTFLSLYVNGKPITAALVLCVLFAIGELLEPPYADARLHWRRPFLLVIAVGVASLALSPFAGLALQKGLVQAAGMLAVILAAGAVGRSIVDRRDSLIALLRTACLAAAVLAGIAIAQSICLNFRIAPGLADFSFLNSLSGGEVWRDAGMIGPVFRVSSLCREPAHLCMMLGMASGVAAIRIGLVGRSYASAVAPILSFRTALAIVLGFVVSLSMLGFVQLLLTVASCWLVSRRVAVRAVIGLAARLAVVLIALVVMAHQTGSSFFEKVETVGLIIAPDQGLDSEVSLSALTIATHVDVLSQVLPAHPLIGIGLGAHPVAYELYAPDWSRAIDGVWGVNADDGASLLLRLLSETGLVGAGLFVFGVVALVLRARRAILDAIDRLAGRGPSTLLVACIGATSAMAAVTLLCLARYPTYYEPAVWILFGFTAAVPWILRED